MVVSKSYATSNSDVTQRQFKMCGFYDLVFQESDAENYTMVVLDGNGLKQQLAKSGKKYNVQIECDVDGDYLKTCPFPCFRDSEDDGLFNCDAFCKSRKSPITGETFTRSTCVDGSGSCLAGCFCHD